MSENQDKERRSTRRVSPDVQQGHYPSLGSIKHRDPETSVGTSPGTVRSILKTGSSTPETGGSTRYQHDTGTITTPSGSQPRPSGMPKITRGESAGGRTLRRLREKEGR